MPIWDIFLQYSFHEFSLYKMAYMVLFTIVFSFIILLVIKILNRTIYLYEESFYVKNNLALIENLIYLNGYIIQEMEGRNHGRRRR